MQTSYYAKYKGENAVSIALSKPKWYTCREYKKLAPSWDLLNKYKDSEQTIASRFILDMAGVKYRQLISNTNIEVNLKGDKIKWRH